MKTFQELELEIGGKRNRLTELFKDGVASLKVDQVDEVQKLNTELNDLATQYKTAQDLEQIATSNRKAAAERDEMERKNGRLPTPQAKSEAKSEPKSVRDYIGAKAALMQGIRQQRGEVVIDMPDVDFKTLITLTTINNQATRQPGLIPLALEERTVGDLMLQGTLDNNSMEYFEETTWTNNAGMVAEGGTKPESAWAVTLRTENMRKIAHNIPMTEEVLDDVAGLEAQVRGRLVFGVQRKEEQQILSGTGVAPQLTGILNRAGIQTQARGADPFFDAFYKAMTKIRNTAFAEPTAGVLNPTDWQNVVLTRTADGLYILGNPGASEAPMRLWGLDIRVTSEMTAGTALVGAFRPYAQLFRRGGITVTMSTEHSTFFVENKVLIQAEERVLLAVYRPVAFCTITGV